MTQESDKEECSGGGLPLRRLQLAFNGIIDNSIPFNLNAIQRHKQLIEEYRQNQKWDQLMKEQINGLQSVQRLKADLRQLDSLTKQMKPEDYHIISEQIAPIRTKVCSVVQQFLESNSDLNNPLLSFDPNCDSQQNHNRKQRLRTDCNTSEGMVCSDSSETMNLQIMSDISERKDSLISWLNLSKELKDLNEIFNTLMTTLTGQRERMDSIQNNVNTSHQNVIEGTQHLSKASVLKSTFVPLTAGLLSGAVFGPIGAVAGFKFAGLWAAVGASIVGYSGTKYIQKKSITEEEIQMISNETQNLNKNKNE